MHLLNEDKRSDSGRKRKKPVEIFLIKLFLSLSVLKNIPPFVVPGAGFFENISRVGMH